MMRPPKITRPTKPVPRPKFGEECPLWPKPERPTDWRAILRECGYPTDVLVLDYETYFTSGYSLKSMSTSEHVNDKRFEVLGLAVLRDIDGKVSNDWYHGECMVDTALNCFRRRWGPRLEGVTVVAHNLQYEAYISYRKYGLDFAYMIDTLGLARSWNARANNDLDTLAKRLKLPIQKGDTKRFIDCSNRTRCIIPPKRGKSKLPPPPVLIAPMSLEKRNELTAYALGDTEIEWEVFKLLLPRLSCPETELPLMQHTTRLFTKSPLRADRERASEIIRDMTVEYDKSFADAGHTKEDISGNKSFDALLDHALTCAGDDPMLYRKDTKNGPAFAIAKTDPQREELENHADPYVRNLMSARIGLKSWPTHISRIENILKQAEANDGYLPVPLKYCGAHTWRFSGGEGINLQNLGSRGHDLVSATREVITADEGHTLVIADASQIEARVLAWIAGQWDLCDKFAKGEEIYCGFASKVLSKNVRKPLKAGKPGYIEAVERWHLWARNSVGKVGVLGCGYGMGANKAVGYAKGAIDLDTAKRLVHTYREENDQIVAFWRDLENAAIFTVRTGKPCSMPRGLRFDQIEGCDLMITLPSGHELKYHDCRLKRGEYGEYLSIYNHQLRSWQRTWGGALTENVVQSMSRHILTGALQRAEARNVPIALHVHDELIGHVPVKEGPAALEVCIEELSRRPVWAPDCPLGAEGKLSPRYGGH